MGIDAQSPSWDRHNYGESGRTAVRPYKTCAVGAETTILIHTDTGLQIDNREADQRAPWNSGDQGVAAELL